MRFHCAPYILCADTSSFAIQSAPYRFWKASVLALTHSAKTSSRSSSWTLRGTSAIDRPEARLSNGLPFASATASRPTLSSILDRALLTLLWTRSTTSTNFVSASSTASSMLSSLSAIRPPREQHGFAFHYRSGFTVALSFHEKRCQTLPSPADLRQTGCAATRFHGRRAVWLRSSRRADRRSPAPPPSRTRSRKFRGSRPSSARSRCRGSGSRCAAPP